jgi:hypothetical protein
MHRELHKGCASRVLESSLLNTCQAEPVLLPNHTCVSAGSLDRSCFARLALRTAAGLLGSASSSMGSPPDVTALPGPRGLLRMSQPH